MEGENIPPCLTYLFPVNTNPYLGLEDWNTERQYNILLRELLKFSDHRNQTFQIKDGSWDFTYDILKPLLPQFLGTLPKERKSKKKKKKTKTKKRKTKKRHKNRKSKKNKKKKGKKKNGKMIKKVMEEQDQNQEKEDEDEENEDNEKKNIEDPFEEILKNVRYLYITTYWNQHKDEILKHFQKNFDPLISEIRNKNQTDDLLNLLDDDDEDDDEENDNVDQNIEKIHISKEQFKKIHKETLFCENTIRFLLQHIIKK